MKALLTLAISAVSILGMALPQENKQTDSTFKERLLATLPEGTKKYGHAAISADGTQVAFVVNKGGPVDGKWFVMVGDTKGEEFNYVGTPVFSSDGKQIAYQAMKNRKWCMVIDHKTGEEFDLVGIPIFGPDGKQLAYPANRGGALRSGEFQGGKWCVVVAGKKGEEFDYVGAITFSPDGKLVAYKAVVEQKWVIMAGEKKSELFDDVGDPVFSPDGTKVAFDALKGQEIWWKIMDVK